MPLHLLHKKSWNVYSPANIERVRHDEAKARQQAAEQEELKLRREADDRLSTLQQQSKGESRRLKRKLPGEDDTDRDIRLALGNTSASADNEKQDHGSLVDANGHIALIPAPEKRPRVDRGQEKDPYTVYLSDAVGGRDRPKNAWYTSVQREPEQWGDENPRKRERALTRLNADDPLAAMKRGVKALRENERQRQEWMRERERDIAGVEEMGTREWRDRKRKKRADPDEDRKEQGSTGSKGTNIDIDITTGIIITTTIAIDGDTKIIKLQMWTTVIAKGMNVGEGMIPANPAKKLRRPERVKTVHGGRSDIPCLDDLSAYYKSQQVHTIST